MESWHRRDRPPGAPRDPNMTAGTPWSRSGPSVFPARRDRPPGAAGRTLLGCLGQYWTLRLSRIASKARREGDGPRRYLTTAARWPVPVSYTCGLGSTCNLMDHLPGGPPVTQEGLTMTAFTTTGGLPMAKHDRDEVLRALREDLEHYLSLAERAYEEIDRADDSDTFHELMERHTTYGRQYHTTASKIMHMTGLDPRYCG